MKHDRMWGATALFVCGIFIAGLANAMSRLLLQQYALGPEALTALPFLSTVLFCVNLSVYLFLLVFWIRSVQQELPDRGGLLRDRCADTAEH